MHFYFGLKRRKINYISIFHSLYKARAIIAIGLLQTHLFNVATRYFNIHFILPWNQFEPKQKKTTPPTPKQVKFIGQTVFPLIRQQYKFSLITIRKLNCGICTGDLKMVLHHTSQAVKPQITHRFYYCIYLCLPLSLNERTLCLSYVLLQTLGKNTISEQSVLILIDLCLKLSEICFLFYFKEVPCIRSTALLFEWENSKYVFPDPFIN